MSDTLRCDAAPETVSSEPPEHEANPGSSAPAESVPYGKLFRWGWRILESEKGLFLGYVAIALCWEVLGLLNVKLLARTVELLTAEASRASSGIPSAGMLGFMMPDDGWQAAIAFLIASISFVCLGMVVSTIGVVFDNRLQRGLQQSLHDRLFDRGPEFHRRHDLGETTLVVTQLALEAPKLMSRVWMIPILQGTLFLMGTLFLVDELGKIEGFPKGLIVALCVCLLAVPLVGWLLARRLQSAYARFRDTNIATVNEYTNSATSPLEVHVLGAEQERSSRFAKKLKALYRDKFKARLRIEVTNNFKTSSVILIQVVFIFAAALCLRDAKDATVAGSILGGFILIPMILQPMNVLITYVADINCTWPEAGKVIEFLEHTPEIAEAPNPDHLPGRTSDISLQGVTFSYDPTGPKIIDGVSYTFIDQKITAIVAKAGGGKSTVLNLVARLRDPQSGVVTIDGHDLRLVSFQSLRENVGKVSQFPLFVTGSVRTNLKLGEPAANDETLEATCRTTGIWRALERAAGPDQHPLDYEIPRDASGGLSGGQRRLLAITRGLLKTPSVLLLDEPTTGVDTLVRQQLIEVLRHKPDHLTVLLVDHDMEFVRRVADVVCCMEDGRFVDVGSPEELLQRDNVFHRLSNAYSRMRKYRPTRGAPDSAPARRGAPDRAPARRGAPDRAPDSAPDSGPKGEG